MTLEHILSTYFNCKEPFLDEPEISNDNGDNSNGTVECFTARDAEAYEALTQLVYDLGELLPDLIDVNEVVETLDLIASEG